MRLVAFAAAALLSTCAPRPSSDAPPEAPTSPLARPMGENTRVSWRQATDDDLDATVLIRYMGTPDGMPMGSALPSVGDPWGSGVVLYAGTNSGYTDSLPFGCDTYTYEMWSHDKAGHWSATAARVTTLPGGQATPLAPPSNLTAKVMFSVVALDWTAASDAKLTRVRRASAAPPASASDGVLVYEGAGNTANEVLLGLPAGQTLYYAAFSCNDCGGCSPIAATANVVSPADDGGTYDAGPDDPDAGRLRPSGLTAMLSADGQQVNFSWTNADAGLAITSVKLVRRLNAPSGGPNDPSATEVFSGLASSASERLDKLLPSVSGNTRAYLYTVYGCENAYCEIRGSTTSFSATLSQALKGGGYTVWWRHASASTCNDQTNLGACSCSNGTCTNCPASEWWKSCDTTCSTATARQLTPPQSTTETTTIHNQFAAKGISVGRVMSSEMCRGRQTAEGFNFGPTVELRQDLTYYVYDEANRCKNNYLLLNEIPAQGTVTAMVGHAGNSCLLLDSQPWGSAAIFKPHGQTSCPMIRPCPMGTECAAGEACHQVAPRNCMPADCVPTFITSVTYTGWATLP